MYTIHGKVTIFLNSTETHGNVFIIFKVICYNFFFFVHSISLLNKIIWLHLFPPKLWSSHNLGCNVVYVVIVVPAVITKHPRVRGSKFLCVVWWS